MDLKSIVYAVLYEHSVEWSEYTRLCILLRLRNGNILRLIDEPGYETDAHFWMEEYDEDVWWHYYRSPGYAQMVPPIKQQSITESEFDRVFLYLENGSTKKESWKEQE